MTPESYKRADELLEQHYYWQDSWRPRIGYGNAAPECRQSVSSRQWDSTADITAEIADKLDMESVDWCLDAISNHARQIIGIEMRGRQNMGTREWSRVYTEAIEEIVPFMRKKNLL